MNVYVLVFLIETACRLLFEFGRCCKAHYIDFDHQAYFLGIVPVTLELASDTQSE